MKRVYLVCSALSVLFFASCKSDEKKSESKEVEKVVTKKAAYVLDDAANTIGWTAYKTTDKVAVNGEFKKVKITSGGEGETLKEAINGTEFSVPVSSIFTKDESRDYKIRKFFFSVMDNTSLLSGKFNIENDSICNVNITMNGITNNVPFKYSINGKEFSMSSTIDINNWNAQQALASLNEACKDLHTGADGVSKTWNEVALNVTSVFK